MRSRKGKKSKYVKGGGGQRKNAKATWEPATNWSEILKENTLFESFYKEQSIVDAAEWDDLMTALRRDLPSTFRITGTKSHAIDLQHCLKTNFVLPSEEGDGSSTPLIKPISWYPDELAWESKLSRKEIRKSPYYEKFHRLLITEQDCGAISRQEAVSMIPPLLLDVQSHHKVLDMCAAPGSKTAQIIETMHNTTTDNQIPSGLVIANDSDSKRCYMLVHQSKRLQTPCCMVTNHDASLFPCIRVPNPGTDTVKQMFFDRILCDVPCSGDGTMRKNPLVWKKWTAHQGVSLHRLQMRILARGLELLAVGGRLVYSTCSMNPLENEAVVATLLRKGEGAVHLVDVSSELPGLKRRPGLSRWKVFKQDGSEIKTYEDVDVGPEKGFKESMFPPTEDSAASLHLDRCMRVYPHDQDTGAFFVAVLQKNEKLPWQSAKIFDPIPAFKYLPWEDVPDKKKPLCLRSTFVPADEAAEAVPQPLDGVDGSAQSMEETPSAASPVDEEKVTHLEPPSKKQKKQLSREDPFIFINDSDPHFIQIKSRYDLSPSFPAEQLLIRCPDGVKRNIYFVSKNVRDVLETNREKLKVVNTGVKVITRYGNSTAKLYDCEFRLTQEGIDVMQSFLGPERLVQLNLDDVTAVLKETEPFQSSLSDSVQKRLSECPTGCLIFNYRATAGATMSSSTPGLLSSDLWVCGHKGKVSVRAMTAKCDRLHFLNVLGVDYDPGLFQPKNKRDKSAVSTSAASVEVVDADSPVGAASLSSEQDEGPESEAI